MTSKLLVLAALALVAAPGCHSQRYRDETARADDDPYRMLPAPYDSDSAYLRDRRMREVDRGRAPDIEPNPRTPREPEDLGGDVFPPNDGDPRQP